MSDFPCKHPSSNEQILELFPLWLASASAPTYAAPSVVVNTCAVCGRVTKVVEAFPAGFGPPVTVWEFEA